MGIKKLDSFLRLGT